MKKISYIILATLHVLLFFGCTQADNVYSMETTAVSVGNKSSFAIMADGSLWAWGNNEYGQLGDGTQTLRKKDPTPHIMDDNISKIIKNNNKKRPVKIMDNVTSISAGSSYTMAIKTDLRPDGASQARSAQLPIKIMDSVISVSTGTHTLALKADGIVWSWGTNDSGQLGDGTTKSRLTPVEISEQG